MSNRGVNKKLVKGVVTALIIPVVLGTVLIKNETEANASIRNIRRTSVGSASRPGVNSLSMFSKTERSLGAISIGVGAISVIGAAVGLGLTESQYEQSKSNYEDVIRRTYNSFYEEREKYMKDLFNQWGVPLPEKYKNPLKTEEENKPTPGFSFGGGN